MKLVYDPNWWRKELCWYKVTNAHKTKKGRWAKARDQRQAVETVFGEDRSGLYFVQAFRYKYDPKGEGQLDDWVFTDEMEPVLPSTVSYQEILSTYAPDEVSHAYN